jgi:NAD(P)-dependent dehydrogenase (short-subunit alcohol dehydrogenase family)
MAGKTVLVTGATGGIGLETARSLASIGALVVIGGRNAAIAEKATMSSVG